MMISLFDIFRSWWISWNPSEKQRKLAAYRIGVCETCPSLQKRGTGEETRWTCGECGCPIPKKVYTSRGPNGCPLRRWKF